MPLEATMMIIDNSEYMRNGDYQPTRFDAQADAVNTVFQTKTDSNPENTVGVMTMAGKGPEVLVTHTKDLGQIIGAIHQTRSKIGGKIDVPTAINIAQLALKHRENKTLRQRIIVFAASPLEGEGTDEKTMVKLAKKLKKNNVAVDFVCFGDGIEEERVNGTEHPMVLKAFVDNVKNVDNSHLLIVPPSTQLLSEALINSPILAGDRTASIPEQLLPGAAEAGPSGATTSNFEFGVDPNLDPDLAMALRMSMQEAQAREAAEAAAAAEASSSATAPNAGQSQASAATSTPGPRAGLSTASAGLGQSTIPTGPTDDEDERMLQQALALTQQEHDEDVDMEGHDHDEGEDEEDEDEDEAIQRAIAMSLEGQDDHEEDGERGNK